MKASEWEMAGGYADAFSGLSATAGAIFSPAGNDAQLGYPMIDVPENVFPFQSTTSGATVFVSSHRQILYPSVATGCFEVLDVLDDFTRANIRQVLAGRPWHEAYPGLGSALLD